MIMNDKDFRDALNECSNADRVMTSGNKNCETVSVLSSIVQSCLPFVKAGVGTMIAIKGFTELKAILKSKKASNVEHIRRFDGNRKPKFRK